MNSDDPLQSLVIDTHEVDRERLATLLHDRVGVDPETGSIRFHPGVKNQSTIKELILQALLGQQALHILAEEHPNGLTPSQLSDVTGIKGGSLRPKLKDLADSDVILKDGDGRYVVPPHSFDAAEGELTEGSDE